MWHQQETSSFLWTLSILGMGFFFGFPKDKATPFPFRGLALLSLSWGMSLCIRDGWNIFLFFSSSSSSSPASACFNWIYLSLCEEKCPYSTLAQPQQSLEVFHSSSEQNHSSCSSSLWVDGAIRSPHSYSCFIRPEYGLEFCNNAVSTFTNKLRLNGQYVWAPNFLCDLNGRLVIAKLSHDKFIITDALLLSLNDEWK